MQTKKFKKIILPTLIFFAFVGLFVPIFKSSAQTPLTKTFTISASPGTIKPSDNSTITVKIDQNSVANYAQKSNTINFYSSPKVQGFDGVAKCDTSSSFTGQIWSCTVSFNSSAKGIYTIYGSYYDDGDKKTYKSDTIKIETCDASETIQSGYCIKPTDNNTGKNNDNQGNSSSSNQNTNNNTGTTTQTPPDTTYTPLAPLPGVSTTIETAYNKDTNPCPFGNYLNIVIKLVIGFSAVLAMLMIVIGGIEYMTSELISGKEEGKERITHAIFGLVIALGAFALLNTLNPQLLQVCFSTPKATIVVDTDLETAPWAIFSDLTGSTTTSCPEGFINVNIGSPGNPDKINVCRSISNNLVNMVATAKNANIILSGYGSRSYNQQVDLRKQHGCPDIMNSPPSACKPQTARPGYSKHETGKAVDFNCNGASMGGSTCFTWLVKNASNYGFYNLKGEPWHWSDDGH